MNAPVLRAVTGIDGIAHLVTDDAMAAGRTAGCYVARCGAELTAPEQSHCRFCRHWRGGK